MVSKIESNNYNLILTDIKISNILELVHPPPQEGSAAFKLDQEIAAKYVAMDYEDRKEQATKDAIFVFPEKWAAEDTCFITY